MEADMLAMHHESIITATRAVW